MIRSIQYSLLKWREHSIRVPLLLRGARQVGKTWVVRDFGKSFSSFVEINFESSHEFHQPFREFFGKTDQLISTIALMTGQQIIPGETLLFLDEIQSCKEALLALRYFKEQMPKLHVIGTGSLLEFSIQDLSFPVGRIEFMHLFPLSFGEFLQASGRDDLKVAIKNAGVQNPLPKAVHQLLLEQVGIYCLLGGMPEVVHTFLESKNWQDSQSVQQRLIATFREDFYKYASRTQVEHLRQVFDSIPRFLGQKFKYSRVDQNVRSRELSQALQLLVDAGLAHKVFHSSSQGLPLSAQIKQTHFKIFGLDIGLCQRLLGLSLAQLFVERATILANRGGLAEQFVAQELLSCTPMNEQPCLYYWQRESKSSQAEVDFVIPDGEHVLPIEVKSQRARQAKSLELFLKEHSLHSPRAVIISSENFYRKDSTDFIPFYAISAWREQ